MKLRVKERVYYFDAIRYLAAVWVFTTHFIAFVDAGLFRYLNRMPVGLIMRGISGKLCVAVFSVVLGYFAYQKGHNTKESTLQYAVKRYVYFAISCFMGNIIYAAAAWLGFMEGNISLLQTFTSAVFIKSDIMDSFWCMRPFLAGSILCFIAGKLSAGFTEVSLLAVMFVLTGQVWIALAMFGVLLALILSKESLQKLLDKKWMQALVIVIAFILINREESTTTYLFDGVFAVGMILVISHNRCLQTVLENKWFRKINKSYMGFYLIHSLSYHTVGAYLLNTCLDIPFKLRFLLVYLLCLAVNILLAWLLNQSINGISRYAEKFVDTALERLSFCQGCLCGVAAAKIVGEDNSPGR